MPTLPQTWILNVYDRQNLKDNLEQVLYFHARLKDYNNINISDFRRSIS